MSTIVTGQKEFFNGIPQIKFEGIESDNPLAFHWYDEHKVVAGKTMKEYLRFACAYWHSFTGNGADPFGEPHICLPGMKKQMPLQEPETKPMQPLNLSPNWACRIIVFMMQTWWIIQTM